MRIVVLLRMVPDVVEELEIAAGGRSLDEEMLRLILSECDEHALEQALLLKERHGGEVITLAPDAAEVDDALFSALAKGVDRALKIDCGGASSVRAVAAAFAAALNEAALLPAALILTGVQSIVDLDGLVAPMLAEKLGLPFLGVVTGVEVQEGGRTAVVTKEFSGGVRGRYEVDLPAILGIQAAEKPPRYVPVAKVRAAMKTQQIGGVAVPEASPAMPGLEVLAMARPEAAAQAEMFEGAPEAAVDKLCEALSARGVL